MPRKPDNSFPSSQAWLVKNRATVSFETKDGANLITLRTERMQLTGYDLIDVVGRAMKIEEARRFRESREPPEAVYSQLNSWIKDFAP